MAVGSLVAYCSGYVALTHVVRNQVDIRSMPFRSIAAVYPFRWLCRVATINSHTGPMCIPFPKQALSKILVSEK